MRTTGGAENLRHRLLFSVLRCGCVHDPVIACDGKVVDSGQLSFETDENGEVEPVLPRDNKCIMHDVKYWMPLPNVEYHPYHSEIVK